MLPLNLRLIRQKLTIVPSILFGDFQQEMDLRDIRLMPSSGLPEYGQHYLYMMIWQQGMRIDSYPPYVICIGGGEEAAALFRKNNMTGMIFSPAVEVSQLMSELQEIFSRYRDLYYECRSLLITRSPMRKILDALSEIVENYVFLLNMKYEVLETCSNYLPTAASEPDARKNETSSCIRKVIDSLRTDVMRIEVNGQIMEYVRGDETRPDYYYVRFFDGNQCIAVAVICQTNSPLERLSRSMLRCLANLLQPCIAGRYSPTVKLHSYIRSAIISILENGGGSSNTFAANLSMIGWEQQDDYQLAYIRTDIGEHRNSRILLDYYRYESLFPDCIAVKMEDCVLIVIHNAQESVLQSSMDSLRQLMTSMKLECRISLPFDNFSMIKSHYDLVRTSLLSLGEAHDNVSMYRDVLVKHILSAVSPFFPITALCHLATIKLHEYDMENGTDLLRTLEKYLMYNRSLQDAATELFIHRNTMNYRMKSIMRITGISLDSATERLHILVSCIVLRSLETDHKRDEG